MNSREFWQALWQTLWQALTRPHPSIQEPERRRRVHLLSSLLVILILGGIVGVLLTPQGIESLSDILIGLAGIFVLGLAYGLSRTKHYPIAVALTMSAIWGSILYRSILADHPETLHFLILTVLISSQFLSPLATALTSFVNIATLLMLSNVSSGFPFHDIIHDVFLVGLTGALATATASVQRLDFKHIEQQANELSAQLIELIRGREALQQGEARLANILENAAEAILAVDQDQNIILFNNGAEKIFGYGAGEVLGQPMEILLPQGTSETHRRLVQVFGAAAQTSRPMGTPMGGRQEISGRRKDGTEFPAQVGISTYTEKGQVIYTAVLIDITERKVAENRIRSEAARAEALARVAARLNAQLDLDTVLAEVCEEAARALNVPMVAIALYDEGSDQMVYAADFGLPEKIKRAPKPLPRAVQDTLVKQFGPAAYFEHLQEFPPSADGELDFQQTIHSLLAVSMQREGNLIGMIHIFGAGPVQEFREEEISLLKGIANEAVQAITNARLFIHAERRLSQVQALHEIDLAITGRSDLQATLGIIQEKVITELQVDAANVIIYDPSAEREDAMDRRTIFVPDLNQEMEGLARPAHLLGEGFISYLAAPLLVKDEIMGVLEVFHRSKLHPNPEWLSFLEALAGQAAIAIDHINLFNNLQQANLELTRAYDATIEGWSRALDLRDKETEGHTRRVTEMTLQLARAVGFRDEDLIQVRRGALLHDIGKMGIPDAILHKPGTLTEEEWVLMRKHPAYACDMLAPVQYLNPALDIPYCHHEKWDGSGYPRGLQGEQIPLAARIFAVVDVWDALTSDRPYRPAWSREETLAYIRDLKGTHFDPQIVDLFLSFLAIN